MQKNIPSKTAELGAMIRAVACKDKYGKIIFSDFYSKYFIGYRVFIPYFFNRILSLIKPSFWAKGMNSVGFLLSLCRHRFMHDHIQAALNDGVEQFVIIGAGYDTSFLIFKEQLSNKKIIEIDHPATQNRKKRISNRKWNGFLNVNMIPVDLANESLMSVKTKMDLKKDKATLVIIEGVLSYLLKEKINEILKALKSFGLNVQVVADYRKTELIKANNNIGKRWVKEFKNLNENYESFFTLNEIENLLKQNGFSVDEHFDLLDLWKKYSNIRPNKQLNQYGGIFAASFGNKS